MLIQHEFFFADNIQEVGNAQYISSFDAIKSYY